MRATDVESMCCARTSLWRGTVNICGLCLSQPRTRSVLEVWNKAVLEGGGGEQTLQARRHEAYQGRRQKAVHWPISVHVQKLEPTGMAAGVQPNGSSVTLGDEASALHNWDETRVVNGQWEGTSQRQAADRSRIKPHSSRARHLLLRAEWLGGGAPEIATLG